MLAKSSATGRSCAPRRFPQLCLRGPGCCRILDVVRPNLTADQSQEAEQLLQAVASNRLVGQATGVLVAVHRVDADTAWDLLRRASRESNIKVTRLATAVLAHASGIAGDAEDPAAAHVVSQVSCGLVGRRAARRCLDATAEPSARSVTCSPLSGTRTPTCGIGPQRRENHSGTALSTQTPRTIDRTPRVTEPPQPRIVRSPRTIATLTGEDRPARPARRSFDLGCPRGEPKRRSWLRCGCSGRGWWRSARGAWQRTGRGPRTARCR